METDEPALAPLAFVRFCGTYRRECEANGAGDVVVALTPETMSLIQRVNVEINRRIRPVSKVDLDPIGIWALNPASGDCNDYAVSKRHELIRHGLPASALLLATARTSWGEGHLLLVLRSDKGDLVLDNLAQDIRSWDSTGYAWIKRQSPVDPLRWDTISTGPSTARIAAAISRAKALAEERATKRREARMLMAQAKRPAQAPLVTLAFAGADAADRESDIRSFQIQAGMTAAVASYVMSGVVMTGEVWGPSVEEPFVVAFAPQSAAIILGQSIQ